MPDGVGLGVVVAEADGDGLGESVGESVGKSLGEAEWDGVADGDGLGLVAVVTVQPLVTIASATAAPRAARRAGKTRSGMPVRRRWASRHAWSRSAGNVL